MVCSVDQVCLPGKEGEIKRRKKLQPWSGILAEIAFLVKEIIFLNRKSVLRGVLLYLLQSFRDPYFND